MKLKNLLTTLTLTAIFLFLGKVGWGQVAGDFRSLATGNWNATSTWERLASDGSTWEAFGVGENTGTGLPEVTSSVFVLDAHTVTINQDVTVANLNIGGGTSGILTFDPAAVRVVVVAGNVTIASGGSFITQAATSRTHTMSIGGDLTNNGEFDMSRGGSTLICNVTFNKPGDQYISGSGTLTRFRLITLDKASVNNRVLCSANVTFGASSTITYTAGTWEQTANTLTVTSGSQNIASANGALVFSGSGSLSMSIAGSIGVTGKLEVNTSGSITMGSGNNSISTSASTAIINFLAGNINVNGRFTLNQGNTTINGASINIDPQVGTTYLGATSQAMEVSGTANLSFISGSVTFVDPLNATGSGVNLLISSTGTVDLSGSTFIFGDGVSVTTGVDGFEISSSLPLNNITLQTGGAALRNVNLKANATVNGNLKLISGALSLGTSTLAYGPSAVIEYAGSAAQSSGAELLTSVPNLTINNTNGVTLTSSTTVVNALTFTDGLIDIGANNLTIVGSTGSIVGASASKYVVTSGTGFLFMNPNGTNDLVYPVGPTSTSYNPFLVTDNTSTDYIGGNIKNSITNASLSDASCVQLEWKATESTTSDNDGTISFQWNASNHGGSFNPAQPVYLGYWNGTGYNKTLVSVTGSDPYVVTIPAPSTIGTNPIIFGNAAAFPLDAPALTADATANTVDNNIEITFTDDATWRAAITAVKDGATTLTVTTDYTIAADLLTLIPNSGNSLKTPGSRTITIVATGYDDATVTQEINVGALDVANSTLSNTPALSSVDKTTTVTATAKDQFANLIEGYIFKFDATTTDANAANNESYTIAGTGYNADAADVALSATNASGVVSFDIVLPAVIDGNDGVSVQLQLNDGTTNFKTPIGYIAPVDPAATISPASIAEHSLNNAVVTILIQNATFAVTLDKVNYTLNNAPVGLTITSITRTDDTHADLTLAYDDAGNDFDVDVANFSVSIAVAELVGASAVVTSNNISLVATVETAPTVTIADAITSVAETTATWAGEATVTGGEAVTEKGICWSTSTNPTIDDVADFKTTEGTGLGVIAGSMTGLTANTTYYVRAYATNSVGTAYSATEKTFVTYSAEPTNHVNTFAVAANAANLVLTWANNDGAVVPTHYLIKASTSDNVSDPVDGTAVPAENLVIGDNTGVKVVAAADVTFTWTGLTAGSTYFFKIYPFTKNTDNLANYKTAAAPAASATVNSDLKAITATTIGTLGASSITNIPATTTVAALKAAITVSANATKDVLVSAGGASAADADLIVNTMVVNVTAQNGTSQNYTLALLVVTQNFFEGFTYAAGQYVGGNGAAGTSSNNWTTHSVTTGQTTTIDVVAGSLDYTGLLASVGNKILLPGANTTVSRDVNSPLTVNSEVAYYSALINVIDNTQLAATADYFMSFGATAGTSVTSLAARLGIKSVNTGANYRLSICNNSGTGTSYTDLAQDLNFGTTYLVVVKLDKSASPVAATLWVNPSTLGGAEPAGSVSNNSGANTFASFASICLRNSSATPKAHIDEIRVGTTFAEVTPAASTDPTTNVSVATLPDFGSIVMNTSSPEASFTVSGSNLTNNVVVTAPAGFDISTVSGAGFTNTNPITLTPATGSVNSTIYVKFHPAAAQAYTGNITVVSTGVTPDKAVAVSGTGVSSDTDAPAFATGYPKSANIGVDKFDVVVNVNEVGKVWFLKLASGAAAPSVADVKAGTQITVTTANTDYSSTISGLTMNTTYDVYFVTEDNQAVPNTLATPVKLSVTTASIPVVTIHDIQYSTATPADSPYKGQQVITKGIVVAVKAGTTTSFYLQNGSGEWNGIYVYASTTPVAVGDSVTFTATVDEYYNLTELKSVTNLTVLNSNNTLPTPASVTVAQAGTEAYEGVFVKLTNVECTVMPNANKEWTVSDGTNTLLVNDFLYEYTPTQGTRYNITGVIDYSFSAFKLNPRSADDVAVYTSTPDRPFASFNVYPNPFSNELRFDGANISRVTVTSIIGQVVMDKTISSENYINTQELVRGIYLVRFTNSKGESILRKLIKE